MLDKGQHQLGRRADLLCALEPLVFAGKGLTREGRAGGSATKARHFGPVGERRCGEGSRIEYRSCFWEGHVLRSVDLGGNFRLSRSGDQFIGGAPL